MDLLLVAGMTAFSALVWLSEYIGLGLGFGLVDTPYAVSAHSTDESNSQAALTQFLLSGWLRIVPPPRLLHLLRLVINELVQLDLCIIVLGVNAHAVVYFLVRCQPCFRILTNLHIIAAVLYGQ